MTRRTRRKLEWCVNILAMSFLVAIFTLLFEHAPDGISVPRPTGNLAEFYNGVLSPLLKFVASLINKLFPWPIVLIAVAYLFSGSTNAFSAALGITRALKKISFFGAEIELNPESKKQIKSLETDLNSALATYREEVRQEIQSKVKKFELDRLLSIFIETKVKEALFANSALPEGFRCTIHIPDLILDGYLYQLLNYYPDSAGAGRIFSERYGIIGKVWRSNIALCVGGLLENSTGQGSEEKIGIITKDWGMTPNEARAALKRPSYLCCTIEADNKRFGVLYMDSTQHDAFSSKVDKDNALTLVREKVIEMDFAKHIGAVLESLEKAELGIKLN